MTSDRFRGTLRPLSLVDLLEFLRGLNRPGLLSIGAEGTGVGLYLRGGSVVQATSTRDSDRLDARLLRSGRITPEQHDEALRLAAGGERMGRALAAAADLSPRELMEARVRQVRDVALSLFEWTAGEFAFIEGEEFPDPALEVDVPIVDLVVEGIRSLKTADLFAARLPSDDWVPAPIPEAERKARVRLEPPEELVLRLADGGRTIGEIASRAEFPDREARRALFLLLAIGHLKMRPRSDGLEEAPDADEVEGLVDRYNGMFGRVHAHLMREVGPISTDLLSKTLHDIEAAHPRLFGGTALGGDGTVDAAQIRDNLGRVPGRGRRDLLVQGLNELLYAELLVVRRTLGAEHEGRLLKTFRGAADAPAGGGGGA